MKTLKNVLKIDKEKYKVPRSVQDHIPIRTIYEDGILKVGNRFSKSFVFRDINYQVAGKEDKEKLFRLYEDFLNSLDSSATAKITIQNRQMLRDELDGSVLMEEKGDGLDEYREEYNQMIEEKAVGASGIYQQKTLTLSVARKTVEEARSFFSRITPELESHFLSLGSKLKVLSTEERLKTLHDFYRGEEDPFSFDFLETVKKGEDLRDLLAPDSIERHKDYLMIGEKYVRTFLDRKSVV